MSGSEPVPVSDSVPQLAAKVPRGGGETRKHRWGVSARLQVTALIGAAPVIAAAVILSTSVFRGSAGTAWAETTCDAGAPTFEVTFNRDAVPLSGTIAGPLSVDSPRVARVLAQYLRTYCPMENGSWECPLRNDPACRLQRAAEADRRGPGTVRSS